MYLHMRSGSLSATSHLYRFYNLEMDRFCDFQTRHQRKHAAPDWYVSTEHINNANTIYNNMVITDNTSIRLTFSNR